MTIAALYVQRGGLELRACATKDAIRWCAQHHRHLRRELAGARFAVALHRAGGERVGVAIVTSGPRVWEGTGRCNIARVATDGTRNACSMLLGAICRAAAALGYVEAWTYTLPHESGSSLRAAGFELVGTTRGGEHDRKGRPRKSAEQPGQKLRWRRVLVRSVKTKEEAI